MKVLRCGCSLNEVCDVHECRCGSTMHVLRGNDLVWTPGRETGREIQL